MAYVVDCVVICDAFREPDKHYELLPGGKSRLVQGRRSSVRFLASAKDVKSGIAGIAGKEADSSRTCSPQASSSMISSISCATKFAHGARPATRARRS